MNNPLWIAGLALWCATAPALAHGDRPHTGQPNAVVKEQKDWGIAGDARALQRTIAVGMSDSMRFSPDRITVKLGETVRFVIRNDGRLPHEYVIGTRQANDEHAALMLRFPNMAHDEPYMAHVAPGQTGEIVWTFNRPGEFDFACLMAGHYQAGMKGRITVTPARGS